MILVLNTAGDPTQIGLLEQGRTAAWREWPAGRQLSRELLPEIAKLLKNRQLDWNDLGGVIIFAGPGSFTGLRIGFATANSIAYSLNIPIAADGGREWQKSALKKLGQTKPGQYVFPRYGSPAKITLPKAK